MAATRDAGTGGRRGPRASEDRETRGGADRARDMVMVDPWGALLAGLLEPPEEEGEKAKEPTGAGPAPGKGRRREEEAR